RKGIPYKMYNFSTVVPNVWFVTEMNPRLQALSNLSHRKKLVYAMVSFVDIAGLVKGASQGEGLGNQFLAHIRETDAIAQVVRCFEDDDVHHVAGRVDPVADAEVINTELALADMETVERALTRVERQARAGDKAAAVRRDLLQRVKEQLDA